MSTTSKRRIKAKVYPTTAVPNIRTRKNNQRPKITPNDARRCVDNFNNQNITPNFRWQHSHDPSDTLGTVQSLSYNPKDGWIYADLLVSMFAVDRVESFIQEHQASGISLAYHFDPYKKTPLEISLCKVPDFEGAGVVERHSAGSEKENQSQDLICHLLQHSMEEPPVGGKQQQQQQVTFPDFIRPLDGGYFLLTDKEKETEAQQFLMKAGHNPQNLMFKDLSALKSLTPEETERLFLEMTLEYEQNMARMFEQERKMEEEKKRQEQLAAEEKKKSVEREMAPVSDFIATSWAQSGKTTVDPKTLASGINKFFTESPEARALGVMFRNALSNIPAPETRPSGKKSPSTISPTEQIIQEGRMARLQIHSFPSSSSSSSSSSSLGLSGQVHGGATTLWDRIEKIRKERASILSSSSSSSSTLSLQEHSGGSLPSSSSSSTSSSSSRPKRMFPESDIPCSVQDFRSLTGDFQISFADETSSYSSSSSSLSEGIFAHSFTESSLPEKRARGHLYAGITQHSTDAEVAGVLVHAHILAPKAPRPVYRDSHGELHYSLPEGMVENSIFALNPPVFTTLVRPDLTPSNESAGLVGADSASFDPVKYGAPSNYKSKVFTPEEFGSLTWFKDERFLRPVPSSSSSSSASSSSSSSRLLKSR